MFVWYISTALLVGAFFFSIILIGYLIGIFIMKHIDFNETKFYFIFSLIPLFTLLKAFIFFKVFEAFVIYDCVI